MVSVVDAPGQFDVPNQVGITVADEKVGDARDLTLHAVHYCLSDENALIDDRYASENRRMRPAGTLPVGPTPEIERARKGLEVR